MEERRALRGLLEGSTENWVGLGWCNKLTFQQLGSSQCGAARRFFRDIVDVVGWGFIWGLNDLLGFVGISTLGCVLVATQTLEPVLPLRQQQLHTAAIPFVGLVEDSGCVPAGGGCRNV